MTEPTGPRTASAQLAQVFGTHKYELMLHCRRTPDLEWLAEWQSVRYVAAAQEVLAEALAAEPAPSHVDLPALARFLVEAVDGLVLQYEVRHEAEQAQADLDNVIIRAAIALAGLPAQVRPGPPDIEPALH